MTTTAMTASARVRSPTTDRSAMTINLHIAAPVVIAAKKINIGPWVPTVEIAVIHVASVTAVDITHTSRQKSGENKDESVTKFHPAMVTKRAAREMG